MAVQQLVQPLLQGRQVAVLEVRYAHQGLAKVTKRQLDSGIMQVGWPAPNCQQHLRSGQLLS